MATRGGISPSGRALRFVLWRAPMGAARYTATGYLNTMQDVSRRWLAWGGFGLWLWLLHSFAQWSGMEGFRQFTSFLLLLWIWRGLVLVRWTLALRTERSRARAIQREMYQTVTRRLPEQIQQWGRQAAAEGGQAFTMLGMKRQADPVAEEHRRRGREQARQVRGWLGDEQDDVPLGDEFEPLFRFPRRPGRKPKGEGE